MFVTGYQLQNAEQKDRALLVALRLKQAWKIATLLTAHREVSDITQHSSRQRLCIKSQPSPVDIDGLTTQQATEKASYKSGKLYARFSTAAVDA